MLILDLTFLRMSLFGAAAIAGATGAGFGAAEQEAAAAPSAAPAAAPAAPGGSGGGARLMLPRDAVAGPYRGTPATWGVPPLAPGRALERKGSLETPSNAASTVWRTRVCPYAPERRDHHHDGQHSGSGNSAGGNTPMSISGGLRTPANVWPTPDSTPASSRFGQRARSTSWQADGDASWPMRQRSKTELAPMAPLEDTEDAKIHDGGAPPAPPSSDMDWTPSERFTALGA